MSVPDTKPLEGSIRAHFSRLDRIRLSTDFQNVFAARRTVVGRLMVIWVGTESEESRLRLGVVASKRTFRRAVDRNRAKRLLREAFRLNKASISLKCDLVIVARRRILGVKCADVERELVWLVNKIQHKLAVTKVDKKSPNKDRE